MSDNSSNRDERKTYLETENLDAARQTFEEPVDAQETQAPNPPKPAPTLNPSRARQAAAERRTMAEAPEERGILLPELESNATRIKTTKTFFPAHRPKVPLLKMMDDNLETGEVFRLRSGRTIIGRTKGDINVFNDAHVSDRHVEIRREKHEDQYLWILADLKSRNGTYVRIDKKQISESDCFLLGGNYFRFTEHPMPENPEISKPALVQIASRSKSKKTFYLGRNQVNLIGHRQQDIEGNVWDDEFMNNQHAKIYLHGNQWVIEDMNSLNGTWMRFNTLRLEDKDWFQIGGQRFLFRIG